MDEQPGKGGKHFALALKEISKDIVARLENNTLKSEDLKEVLDSTVREMNLELINEEKEKSHLTFAAYNIALMCLAHYVILESKIYNKYKQIPDEVLLDRDRILSYFHTVVQTRIQEGRALKNQNKVKENTNKISDKKKEHQS